MRKMMILSALSALLALSPLAPPAQAEPPTRWFPPRGDSPCWALYAECQGSVYLAYQEGQITETQLRNMLAQCRLELGWCALVERIREMVPDQWLAEQIVESIGEESTEALIGLADD